MALFGNTLKNVLSNTVGKVGKSLNIPEMGFSERIAAPAHQKKSVQGAQAPSNSYPGPIYITNGNTSLEQYRNNGGTPSYGGGSSSYAPATSGQSYSSDSGGDNGGGVDQSYIDRIRSEFGNVRDSYGNMINSYDSDYNIAKSGTDEALTRAKTTLTDQTADEERRYGENLRSLLQTDRELRDRRTGTFSALGTLDSSAYQEDVTKGDQTLSDNRLKIAGERDRVIRDKNTEYSAYEKKATGELASYANEISRAKEGLRQAVAESNMNEANSILSYIDQMKQRAQAVQDQREAMKMNLAQLAAQGVDVIGNLGKINSTDFSNAFGSTLKNTLASATNRYSLPDSSTTMSGYINPRTGKPYTEEEKKLQMMA